MTAQRLRRTVLAAAVTLLLGGTGSCFDGATPDPNKQSSDNALIWYIGSTDQNQEDYARSLADDFEVANPPIKVEVRHTPKNTDRARETLIKALRPGVKDPPDVYLGDVIWPVEFAVNGRALPLNDQFEANFWKRFDSAQLQAATYRGRIYAAPFFADQGMLFYWKDLVPTPPKTWEDLVQDAKTLVEQGKVKYGYVWQGAAYEGLTCIWTEMLADAGGSTLTTDGSRSAIDSPEARRALRFLRDLVVADISPPELTGFEESEARQLFALHQVAFLRGWNVAYSRLVPNTPDNPLHGRIGVTSLPSFAGRSGPGYSTVGGWNLYINPNTHRLDAAKKFIRWMTDVQAQLRLAKLSHIPTNVAVRRDHVAWANPAVAAGLRAARVSRPSNTPEYPAVSRAVYRSLHAALDGKLTPEVALHQADQEINRVLR
jgi:multiple sugar transport system substrate-binding protein